MVELLDETIADAAEDGQVILQYSDDETLVLSEILAVTPRMASVEARTSTQLKLLV